MYDLDQDFCFSSTDPGSGSASKLNGFWTMYFRYLDIFKIFPKLKWFRGSIQASDSSKNPFEDDSDDMDSEK